MAQLLIDVLSHMAFKISALRILYSFFQSLLKWIIFRAHDLLEHSEGVSGQLLAVDLHMYDTIYESAHKSHASVNSQPICILIQNKASFIWTADLTFKAVDDILYSN